MRNLVEVARRYLTRPPERVTAVSPFAPFIPLSHLSGPGEVFPVGHEPWDEREARVLVGACRASVIRLGVDTEDPELAAAAAVVTSAMATRDMETVRFACSEFAVAIREVASRG